MSRLGIYIHVPFCGRKCAYCDFYSVNWSKSAAVDYTAAVLRNIQHYGDNSRIVDTVYFGGGTPSLLTAEQISSIISEIRSCFALEESAEITLEANPCTLSAEKLAELRKIGINRLSIGVQSMIDRELKRKRRDTGNAFTLPDQKPEDMRFSIERMAALPIQHISAYILKTENGTPFDCAEIRDRLPDEDSTAELYLDMVELLEKQGFMQYEVSNFAKEGFESRHNTRYWKCLDYLGIGPAAHSCYEGKRFAVERDLSAFIAADAQQVTVTDESPCGFEEFAMLRLRLKEGLILDDVPEHRAELLKKLPPLVKDGYAETDGERIRLTPKGFLMSNSVIEYLVF